MTRCAKYAQAEKIFLFAMKRAGSQHSARLSKAQSILQLNKKNFCAVVD